MENGKCLAFALCAFSLRREPSGSPEWSAAQSIRRVSATSGRCTSDRAPSIVRRKGCCDPETCQRQVNPGFTLKRRFCQASSIFSASRTDRGRGPTMLMSPSSTLTSCGNSSMLVLRSHWPTRVMRGSLLILKIGPDLLVQVLNLLHARFGIPPHRAELEHAKAPLVEADAFLNKEDRAARIELDGHCDQPQQRRQQNQQRR